MIAAALGLSRFKTPLDAYLDVRHEAPPVEATEDMDRGVFLEPGVRNWSAKKLGTKWEVPELPAVHPANSWFTYSADGVEVGGRRLLEVKVPGDFNVHDWGEPGTDNVPLEYLLQGAWGLAVMDLDEAVFAAPIGGELRIYHHKRDRELEEKLISRATAFINQHVIPGIPPPPTFADAETVKRMWPKNERPAREWDELNSLEQATVIQYLELHAIEKQARDAKESKEVLVKDIIRDAGGLKNLPVSTGYERIDWNTSKPAMNAGTWKALAEELLSSLPIDQQQQLKKKHLPAVGSRPFTPRSIGK